MSKLEKIKIGANGEQLPKDAAEWAAVLLPQHGLMFTANPVTSNMPQSESEAAAKACTVAGFKDWDLPEIDQLQLIIDRSRTSPAIDINFFKDIESDWCWTKTAFAGDPAYAWYVYFYYGNVFNLHRGLDGFALACRRAGQ